VTAKLTPEQRWLEAEDELLGAYNCVDTWATAQLTPILINLLKQQGQWDFWEREVWTQLPAVLAMQERGIPFSQERKGLYRRALRRELKEIDEKLLAYYAKTARLDEMCWNSVIQLLGWLGYLQFSHTTTNLKALRRRGAPYTKSEQKQLAPATWKKVDGKEEFTGQLVNLDSDDQLRKWLFADLGLKPSGTETEGGDDSVNQHALASIHKHLRKMDEPHRWVVEDLMHRARLSHIDTTYLDVEVTNGRVYPSLKMIGTETGRFAFSEPPVHSWSDRPAFKVKMNGQGEVNIKGLQGCIVAPPGQLIVSCDYSAMEARIFANVTNDAEELELFEKARFDPDNKHNDIHIRNVCGLFGWTVEHFLEQTPEYQKLVRTGVGKAFQFGVKQYGAKPTSVKTKDVCVCPRCEQPDTISFTSAQKDLQARRWFQRHPNVPVWRRDISSKLRSTHRLVSRMGQVRYFHQPWSSKGSPNALEREGWNSEIQSVATVILRRAMRRLHEAGVALFLEWHDSLKALARESEALDVAKLMKVEMERPVPEFGGFVFPVEIEVGPSLGEMKKVHL
jgi:DNA polymerase I-like protein with 3'-5' exonuclease and polymerase domains